MRAATFYGVILASLAVAVGCGDTVGNAALASVGGMGGGTAALGGASNVVISPNGGAAVGVGGGAGVGGVPAVATTVPAAGGSGGQVATLAKGGAQAAGGTNAIGGTSAVGGTKAAGGTSTVGGSKAAGGTSAVGGTKAAGGTSATGGTTAKGGTSATGTSTGYSPCPTDGSACKIMPFGDSITHGYNPDTPGGYRVELFRLAHSAGKNVTFVGSQTSWGVGAVDGVTFPPNHEGYSGYTIDPTTQRSGISPLVSTAMPAATPHIVLLMIGTNDCIDNYNLTNAPTRLGNLIDSIYAQLPNVLIVVAQPIPSRGDSTKGDDTALSGRIETYNATIPGVIQTRASAGKHILLVDMYTPFAANKASLMEDQWHPNPAGYVTIGTQWYSKIANLLR